jgi:hypothetical protein
MVWQVFTIILIHSMFMVMMIILIKLNFLFLIHSMFMVMMIILIKLSFLFLLCMVLMMLRLTFFTFLDNGYRVRLFTSEKLQPGYYNILKVPQQTKKLIDHNTDDEILSANLLAPSPSMVGKNLHGHHLELLVDRCNHLLVLLFTF